MEILRRFATPGPGPTGLTWDRSALWCADFQDGHIYRLNPESGQADESILYPGVASGLTWDGKHLWQAVMDEGWLRAINPESHDFDRTIVVENAARLSGLAWDGHYLWAVSQQRGALLAIDPNRERVVRTLSVPVGGGGLACREGELWVAVPERMRFSEQNQAFEWISQEREYFLLRLEAESGREVERHPLDFLPLGLTWAGDELWLSNPGQSGLYSARI